MHEKGDIKALTDALEGFYRLRVGSHRVVFEFQGIESRRVITCVFAGPRKWIYDVFQSRLLERCHEIRLLIDGDFALEFTCERVRKNHRERRVIFMAE